MYLIEFFVYNSNIKRNLFSGWAIITGSWTDVYSQFYKSDKKLMQLLEDGDFTTLASYGVTYSYGMYQSKVLCYFLLYTPRLIL